MRAEASDDALQPFTEDVQQSSGSQGFRGSHPLLGPGASNILHVPWHSRLAIRAEQHFQSFSLSSSSTPSSWFPLYANGFETQSKHPEDLP